MAYVSLKRIIDKMKLENLTPELDISKVRINQPDINRPAQIQGASFTFSQRMISAINAEVAFLVISSGTSFSMAILRIPRI